MPALLASLLKQASEKVQNHTGLLESGRPHSCATGVQHTTGWLVEVLDHAIVVQACKRLHSG